jgi:hypothetical protein
MNGALRCQTPPRSQIRIYTNRRPAQAGSRPPPHFAVNYSRFRWPSVRPASRKIDALRLQAVSILVRRKIDAGQRSTACGRPLIVAREAQLLKQRRYGKGLQHVFF